MENSEIKQLIEQGIEQAKAHVQGDGRHFDALVISDAFAGLNRVKRQQLVYKTLGDNFSTGSIHALNMKAFTEAEWETQQHNYKLPNE